MSRQIVKFLKTHGRYVKGDVAGFAPETVAAWPKGVCVPHDPNAATVTDSLKLDTSEAQKLVEDARAEFAQKEADLAAREADLKAREEAVAAREAEPSTFDLLRDEIEKLPGNEPSTEDEKVATGAPAKKSAGVPPKQGAKA